MSMKEQVLQQKVSLFQNLQSTPSKAVGLEEVVRLVRYDKDVAGKTDSYRKMMAVLGKDKADEEVKRKKMAACSIGVLFDGNGRGAANVLGFTGLALCDIDGLQTQNTHQTLQTLPPAPPYREGSDYTGSGKVSVNDAFEKAKNDPHTLIVYRTISGHGLRIIYRYVRESEAEGLSTPLPHREGPGGGSAISWKASFLHGNQYFAELVGHEYDEQCSDYSRLCGLAHDEEVYVNWEAEPFVITDEKILAANFDGSGEKGKPRKEHPAGTYNVTIDDAWPKVEQALQKRGMVYQSGHHHDYVMHAAFLMNRYGVDLDELLEWAGQEWSDYDAKQREATIRSCYKKTQEHGTWRLNRQGRKSKETSMITLPEIRQWLSQRVEVVYNLVTDQMMFRILPPKFGDDRGLNVGMSCDCSDPPLGSAALLCKEPPNLGGSWGQLDERVLCSMRSQMAADTGKRVLKSDVRDVLNSDFARLHHPVREYIEALPPWDGVDRVKELCGHVEYEDFGVQGNYSPPSQGGVGGGPLFEWALHKWLVASLATWMSDLSTNHEIFVLIGSQGIYKTTFFRHLLPPQLRGYFWENAHNSFASKDDHLALAENCLVEIEEIDLQNPRDISELKALATSEKVKERRPYARFREEKHRLASFCGSGNQQRFLSDDTGNRRWLCFKVSHIDDPRTWGIDYDQLYAQLRDEWRRGFRYWFDLDEQRIVERQNQHFRIESDEEQLIRSRLRPPHAGEKITLMNAASIAQYINGGVVGRGLSSRKVSLAMGRLGFKSVHTKAGNFFEVYQIPANEIQPTLAYVDENAENAPSMPTMTEGDLPF